MGSALPPSRLSAVERETRQTASTSARTRSIAASSPMRIEHVGDPAADLARFVNSPKPRVVIAGVPMRSPLVTDGGRGSSGTAFLLTVMCARPSASSASLPV